MLPLKRNTNYTQGAEIKSADLNDIQDMIIAGKHGEIPLQLNSSNAAIVSGGMRPHGDGYLVDQGLATYHIPTLLGTRVKSVRVFCKDSPGARVRAQLAELDVTSGGILFRSGPMISNATGANQSFLLPNLTAPPTAVGRRLHVRVVAEANSQRIYGVTVFVERA